MSIFVDTADIEQAKAAKEFGWVRGITTNPILLAKSCNSASDTLQQLAGLNMGLLFYQLVSSSKEDMLKEAHLAKKIAGRRIIAHYRHGRCTQGKPDSDTRCQPEIAGRGKRSNSLRYRPFNPSI